MLALKLLEKLTSKEKATAIIEGELEKPLTFSEYPHSAEWILKTREKSILKLKRIYKNKQFKVKDSELLFAVLTP